MASRHRWAKRGAEGAICRILSHGANPVSRPLRKPWTRWSVNMSNVLQFKRRGASREVIDNLVKLGYLERRMRHDAGAIEDALARLQNDLCRSQVICGSDQLDGYQPATMGC